MSYIINKKCITQGIYGNPFSVCAGQNKISAKPPSKIKF